MAKRKIKTIDITCRYCDIFFISPRDSLKERKCSIIDELVIMESPACKRFTPTIWFWCEDNASWRHIDACFSKIKRKDFGCTKCHQGKIIMKIKEEHYEKS